MRKVIFIVVILMSLIISSLSHSSETLMNVKSSTIQSQEDEWVEYVLIDGILFKITHYQDGSTTIIQASGGSD